MYIDLAAARAHQTHLDHGGPSDRPDVARLVIVDDHPIVRRGLAQVIGHHPDLELVAEFTDGADAITGMRDARPDLAIVDLSLGESSGLELIVELKREHPSLSVLVLSMHDEQIYAERALEAGAAGFISKAEGVESVISAVRRVLAGEVSVSLAAAHEMVRKLATRGVALPKRLTARQLEVFELIGAGFTSREIAGKLHLSIKTVESHREHIKERLELADAGELMREAIAWAFEKRGLVR